MEITSRSKLFDVLKAYPTLEDKIVRLAPPFANLKNPVLRRTVGQLATLERVAQIGGLEVTEFVNMLRREVGLPELRAETPTFAPPPPRAESDPAWIEGEPQFVVNGSELLKRGEVPLQHVNQLLPQLQPDRYILLITDFEPIPMIEAMRKQNRRVYHKVHPTEVNTHLTYIG
ncbi:MAG: DUF1858 domain-containing protein [Anaerolineae bacterium]|nr:DUF1858 domain-containing protein [Anaerolineae bacterium]